MYSQKRNILLAHIKYLFQKDLTLEWRQKYALGGALLYIVSTVFITHLVFEHHIDRIVWNALFWIIIVLKEYGVYRMKQ